MSDSFKETPINRSTPTSEKRDAILKCNGKDVLIKNFHYGSEVRQWFYGAIKVNDNETYSLVGNSRIGQDNILHYHDLWGLMIAED